jgi:RNA polymerase sigma-70 factor, ECF subfamily
VIKSLQGRFASAMRGQAQEWCKIMDLHATQSVANYTDSANPAVPSPKRPEQGDHSLHRQIEALIPRLTRYARVLTRDQAAADDLVQECLTRALGKIHLWEQGTDLRAWLFTILHHQHVSHTRRDARQSATLGLQKNLSAGILAPNQTVQLELRDLERAIAQLPEEQRSVILLVGLNGMRYDEAAAVVDLPVGTVRSRVSRGRESLRAMTGLFPSRHSLQTGARSNPEAPRRQVNRKKLCAAISGTHQQEILQ